MTKFIDFTKDEQTNFLQKVKNNTTLSWEKLGNELRVSRSMIFAYKKRVYRLSFDNFMCLCKIGNINPKDYSLNFFQVTKKKILTPNLNDELSEFLGILAGDGHMDKVSYEVSITGHKANDYIYIKNHVYKMFENLFGIEPKIRFQNNAIRCWVYAKKLVMFISNEFKLPIGRKKNKLRIPTIILNNKKFLISFIRGLFDTDGSIYTHHGNDMMLEISNVCPEFREDIIEGLKTLEFHPSKGIKNVVLYRQNEITRFFNLIQPKNNNHLKRFRQLQNMRQ